MYVWRYGGRVGIEPQRSRGLEVVQVWRSGGHAGMEPQRSGDLEVWICGGMEARSGGRAGMQAN
jgi:hypothetical protein